MSIRQTPQQSRAVFEAMALQFLPDLGRFAMSLTHRREEAEDLVQDTFCRALEKFQTFDGRNIRSWLCSIMYSLFIDGCRRRKIEGRTMAMRPPADGRDKNSRVLDPLDSPEVIEAAGGIANEGESHLACEEIQRAIDALPDEFRSVIVLREQNDMSYKEIAAILGCPAGTVMSRLNRGRRMLQEMLRDQAEELGIPVPPRPQHSSSAAPQQESEAVGAPGADSVADAPLNAPNAPIDLNAYREKKRQMRREGDGSHGMP